MIKPIEVSMPDNWEPRKNPVDIILDGIFEKTIAQEFIEFQRKNKSGIFFEAVDKVYQEKDEDALAEGQKEQEELEVELKEEELENENV